MKSDTIGWDILQSLTIQNTTDAISTRVAYLDMDNCMVEWILHLKTYIMKYDHITEANRPILGFSGSKVHKNGRFPGGLGRRWTAVQNVTLLALSLAETSVIVQIHKKHEPNTTHTQTVTDISTPCLSACVDNNWNSILSYPSWRQSLMLSVLQLAVLHRVSEKRLFFFQTLTSADVSVTAVTKVAAHTECLQLRMKWRHWW